MFARLTRAEQHKLADLLDRCATGHERATLGHQPG
jgi:hypothetical protein